MAKRMTATEKWDKEWFMSLSTKHKCLWFYLNDKCDQAGMWEENYRLASMHIGENITISDMDIFGDRVEKFAPGKIWVVGHIDFQCGTLSESSPAHKPIFKLLKKYTLLDRVLKGLQCSPKEKEIEKEIELDRETKKKSDVAEFEDYELWTDSVIKGTDWLFTDKLNNMGIPINGQLPDLARSHLALLAKYPKMKPTDQNKFRISLIGHIHEKMKEGPHKAPKKEIKFDDVK